MALVKCHVPFDCAGSHRTMSPEVSRAIFQKKYQMALVKCHVPFDCAGSHRTMSPEVSQAILKKNAKWLLWNVMCLSTAQARTERCPRRCPRLFFQKKIPNGSCEMSCAFRLRRLAQKDVPGGVPGHFSKKNAKWLLCNVMCLSTAQARTERCPRRCPRPFLKKNQMALVKRHVPFDCAGSHRTMSPEVSQAILKKKILYFAWSPPWHSIPPIWQSIWHIFWHSVCISSDILSVISSDILSGISFGGWGPAANTGRGWSWLRSGSEHWAWLVVVEVRQRTLGVAGRGWGPAANTGRGWSWLRSGSEPLRSGKAIFCLIGNSQNSD